MSGSLAERIVHDGFSSLVAAEKCPCHEWCAVKAPFLGQAFACQSCHLHLAMCSDEGLAKNCAGSDHSHHLHLDLLDPFGGLVNVSCCLCGESVSFFVRTPKFEDALTDIWKGKSLDDRLSIVGVFITYVGGLLQGNKSQINSSNASFQKYIGGLSASAVSAMKVLGYHLNDKGFYCLTETIDTNILQDIYVDLCMNQQNLRKNLGLEIIGNVTIIEGNSSVAKLLGSTYSSHQESDSAEHFKTLGCLRTISDERLKWAFLCQLQDSPTQKHILLTALTEIASTRNNSDLHEFIAIERTKRNIYTIPEISDAYRAFNLSMDDPVSEEILVSLYYARIQEQSNTIELARRDLRVIAAYLQSDALDIFLDTGAFAGVFATSTLPIGLENFGNICYLNSLLQLFVTMKPLKDIILTVDSSRSKSSSLKAFLVGIKNQFTELIGSSKMSVPVDRDLAMCLVGESEGQQQDVGEFMNVFLETLEKALVDTGKQEDAHIIKRLCFGKTKQSLEYHDKVTGKLQTGVVEDPFLYLMIDIEPTLEQSLQRFFAETKVEYEGQEAKRRLSISQLPPILTFQLRRVNYDIETSSAVKLNQMMFYNDQMDMSRFVNDGHERIYTLHAVLQHEGEAQFGHYRIFIRNYATENKWFLYDDSNVSVVTSDLVFRDTTGTNANAYFLVYVDAKSKDEMVQTFVRR